MDSALNQQISLLLDQGLTPEQIGQALGLNPQMVGVISAGLKANGLENKSFEETYGDLEAVALNALKITAVGSENDSAKVQAAKILLEYNSNRKARKTSFDYDSLAQALKEAGNQDQRTMDKIQKVEFKTLDVENKETPKVSNLT